MYSYKETTPTKHAQMSVRSQVKKISLNKELTCMTSIITLRDCFPGKKHAQVFQLWNQPTTRSDVCSLVIPRPERRVKSCHSPSLESSECVCVRAGIRGLCTLHLVWKGSEDKGNEQWTEMTEMSSFLKREKDRSLWRLPFMIPLKKNTGP